MCPSTPESAKHLMCLLAGISLNPAHLCNLLLGNATHLENVPLQSHATEHSMAGRRPDGRRTKQEPPWHSAAYCSAAGRQRTCVFPVPFLAAALLFLATNLVGSPLPASSSCTPQQPGKTHAFAALPGLPDSTAGACLQQLEWTILCSTVTAGLAGTPALAALQHRPRLGTAAGCQRWQSPAQACRRMPAARRSSLSRRHTRCPTAPLSTWC